jgi:transcriptional regulator with XRE-family HTH domain
MNIGPKIRSLRLNQKRTLQEIADVCGFTRGLLSKIENGKTTPPIATLTKIANALGVKVAAFLEDGATNNKTVFVPRDQTDPSQATLTSKGYGFIPIFANRLDKVMQPYVFVAYKDQVTSQPLSHDGEEFIYILEGDVKYRVGTVEYTMTAGDSLYFDSIEEHHLTPISERVVFLAVFTQPKSS